MERFENHGDHKKTITELMAETEHEMRQAQIRLKLIKALLAVAPEKICGNCKWPELYLHEEYGRMMREHCSKCPISSI